MTGMVRDIKAAVRHAIKVPMKNVVKKPRLTEISANEIKIPRTEGSLK